MLRVIVSIVGYVKKSALQKTLNYQMEASFGETNANAVWPVYNGAHKTQ